MKLITSDPVPVDAVSFSKMEIGQVGVIVGDPNDSYTDQIVWKVDSDLVVGLDVVGCYWTDIGRNPLRVRLFPKGHRLTFEVDN